MYNRYPMFPGFRAKALTLSYDDGVDTDRRLIDLMAQYGIKGTFNINAGLFSPEGAVRPEGQIHFRLSKSEAAALYQKPFVEVATHAYGHSHLETLPGAAVMDSIIQDRKCLEEIFGGVIRGHAYAFGGVSDTVVDVLRMADVAYARTVTSHHAFHLPTDWLRLPATCHHNDDRLFDLADQFLTTRVEQRNPFLFYLWGHSYEFRQHDNWDRIEKFFDQMAGRDEVWYATNMEIHDYLEAYHRLRYSVDGHTVCNPTATDVWFFADGEQRFLPAGQTRTF